MWAARVATPALACNRGFMQRGRLGGWFPGAAASSLQTLIERKDEKMLSNPKRITKELPRQNADLATIATPETDNLPVRLAITGRIADIEKISRLMRASGAFIEEIETSDRVIGFVSIVAGIETLDDQNGPAASKLVRRTLSVRLETEEAMGAR